MVSTWGQMDKVMMSAICALCLSVHPWHYLVHIMMVHDAVEALVDVVEHVHHFHWRAVLTQSGESDDVTEIDCHLLVQLRLHHAGLFKAFHHWAKESNIQTDRRTGMIHRTMSLWQSFKPFSLGDTSDHYYITLHISSKFTIFYAHYLHTPLCSVARSLIFQLWGYKLSGPQRPCERYTHSQYGITLSTKTSWSEENLQLWWCKQTEAGAWSWGSRLCPAQLCRELSSPPPGAPGFWSTSAAVGSCYPCSFHCPGYEFYWWTKAKRD